MGDYWGSYVSGTVIFGVTSWHLWSERWRTLSSQISAAALSERFPLTSTVTYSGVRILILVTCFTLPSAFWPSDVPDETKSRRRSRPTEAACWFNVQLCIAEEAAEFFCLRVSKGVASSGCKHIDLRLMVVQFSLIEQCDCPINIRANNVVSFYGLLMSCYSLTVHRQNAYSTMATHLLSPWQQTLQ